MKLAVVGSTGLGGKASRQYIIWAIQTLGATTVISGGARGIDALAARVGCELGLKIIEFKPESQSWEDRDGRKGFKTRNQEIVDACDSLLRISWYPKEQEIVTGRKATYGSGWTRDRAKAQGKLTLEFALTLEEDHNGIYGW